MVQCKFCNNWQYGKCSLTSKDGLNELPIKDKLSWCCSKCTAENLPFHCTDENDCILEYLQLSNGVSSDLEIVPSQGFNQFVTECYSIASDLTNNVPDINSEKYFPNNINSRYLDIPQFNQN